MYTRCLEARALLLSTCLLTGGQSFCGTAWGQQSGDHPKPRMETVAKEDVTPKPRPKAADLRSYALKNSRAERIVGTLQSVLGTVMEARVFADERTNTLFVAADNAADFERVDKLVQTLDQPEVETQTNREVLQKIKLSQADARVVSERVRMLLEPGGTRAQSATARIFPDRGANEVYFFGREKDVDLCLRIARQLDVPSASSPDDSQSLRELKFYALKEADAAPLSGTVTRAAKALELDADIFADPQSNMLVAVASEGAQHQIAGIIATLDVPARRPAGPPPQLPPSAQK